MAATTKTDEFLLNCPACKKHINAELTYSVKLNERARAEGQAVDLIDATATATLTLTGVRVTHDCTPKQLMDFAINPALPNPFTRED